MRSYFQSYFWRWRSTLQSLWQIRQPIWQQISIQTRSIDPISQALPGNFLSSMLAMERHRFPTTKRSIRSLSTMTAASTRASTAIEGGVPGNRPHPIGWSLDPWHSPAPCVRPVRCTISSPKIGNRCAFISSKMVIYLYRWWVTAVSTNLSRFAPHNQPRLSNQSINCRFWILDFKISDISSALRFTSPIYKNNWRTPSFCYWPSCSPRSDRKNKWVWRGSCGYFPIQLQPKVAVANYSAIWLFQRFRFLGTSCWVAILRASV